jgi:F-type H+-transporting ATPase subunit gamma
MAALKAIKNKIRSIEKTQKVTKAMEAVSAAKMRKAQAAAVASRAYARAATSILARLSGTRQAAYTELAATRPIHRALYIVITSDKGLAGALNSAVLRATAADIAKSGLPNSAISVIAVGRKANDYFTSRGIEVLQYYPNTDDIHNGAMESILNTARMRFELSSAGEGAADTVKIAYQNFISTFEQRPTLRTIFPLSLDELRKVVTDIVPARGAFARAGGDSLALEGVASRVNAYSIEPSEEEVLAAIIPLLAGIFLYHALLESQASEHSARMVSMKAASDNAATLTDTLTIKFNKARQATITQEISEITGGMAAMQA